MSLGLSAGRGLGVRSTFPCWHPELQATLLTANCLLGSVVVWWPEEQKVFSGCFVLSPGHEVHQTIYMINSEKEAFSFAFRESSLFAEGCNASVKIEPLEGSIAPLSR